MSEITSDSDSELISIEFELAHNPIFADPDRIIARRRETYYLYLEALAFEDANGPWAEALKWPGFLLEAFADCPSIRSILNEWFRAKKCFSKLSFYEFSRERPCVHSFVEWIHTRQSSLALDLFAGDAVSGLASWRRINYFNSQPSPGWMIARTRAVYMDEIGRDLGHGGFAIGRPSGESATKISFAIQSLAANVPVIARSLFQHVSQIAWVNQPDDETAFDGASSDSLPGVIFGMPRSPDSAWAHLEIIFHEACHQKMFDVIATNPIYRSGYSSDTAMRIASPWNRDEKGDPTMWHIDRALLAAHVYVYLAYITCHVLAKSEMWKNYDVDATSGYVSSVLRANYLIETLICKECNDIETKGRHFLQWLRTLLKRIESVGTSIGISENACFPDYTKRRISDFSLC